ncbi:MAG: hypothetical protein ACI8PZ_001357 [Myxococcota bacterium]|jgi:hypothetical protein
MRIVACCVCILLHTETAAASSTSATLMLDTPREVGGLHLSCSVVPASLPSVGIEVDHLPKPGPRLVRGLQIRRWRWRSDTAIHRRWTELSRQAEEAGFVVGAPQMLRDPAWAATTLRAERLRATLGDTGAHPDLRPPRDAALQVLATWPDAPIASLAHSYLVDALGQPGAAHDPAGAWHHAAALLDLHGFDEGGRIQDVARDNLIACGLALALEDGFKPGPAALDTLDAHLDSAPAFFRRSLSTGVVLGRIEAGSWKAATTALHRHPASPSAVCGLHPEAAVAESLLVEKGILEPSCWWTEVLATLRTCAAGTEAELTRTWDGVWSWQGPGPLVRCLSGQVWTGTPAAVHAVHVYTVVDR